MSFTFEFGLGRRRFFGLDRCLVILFPIIRVSVDYGYFYSRGDHFEGSGLAFLNGSLTFGASHKSF